MRSAELLEQRYTIPKRDCGWAIDAACIITVSFFFYIFEINYPIITCMAKAYKFRFAIPNLSVGGVRRTLGRHLQAQSRQRV